MVRLLIHSLALLRLQLCPSAPGESTQFIIGASQKTKNKNWLFKAFAARTRIKLNQQQQQEQQWQQQQQTNFELGASLRSCLDQGVAFSAQCFLSGKKKNGAIFQLNNCRRQVFTFVDRTQPSRKIAANAERNSRTRGRQDDKRGNGCVHSMAQQFASVSVFQGSKCLLCHWIDFASALPCPTISLSALSLSRLLSLSLSLSCYLSSSSRAAFIYTVAAQPFNNNFLVYFQDDLPGQALLDVVFARLNLIETSYFGIRYIDDENQTVSGGRDGVLRAGYGNWLAHPASALAAAVAAAVQTYWFLKFIFVFIEIHWGALRGVKKGKQKVELGQLFEPLTQPARHPRPQGKLYNFAFRRGGVRCLGLSLKFTFMPLATRTLVPACRLQLLCVCGYKNGHMQLTRTPAIRGRYQFDIYFFFFISFHSTGWIQRHASLANWNPNRIPMTCTSVSSSMRPIRANCSRK